MEELKKYFVYTEEEGKVVEAKNVFGAYNSFNKHHNPIDYEIIGCQLIGVTNDELGIVGKWREGYSKHGCFIHDDVFIDIGLTADAMAERLSRALAGLAAVATDTQVGGDHYKNFEIQPIEFINANELSFIQGSIVKYICRYKNKNGIEDLEKVKHYVDLLIELEFNGD